MKELPDDFIDALLHEPVIPKQGSILCTCGSKLEMGYCLNPECEWDAPEEVFDCKWCGCCADPKHCVWSVTCPICKAVAKEHCVEGKKLVGLHAERWSHAGRNFQD